jgi:hypothetical protein
MIGAAGFPSLALITSAARAQDGPLDGGTEVAAGRSTPRSGRRSTASAGGSIWMSASPGRS